MCTAQGTIINKNTDNTTHCKQQDRNSLTLSLAIVRQLLHRAWCKAPHELAIFGSFPDLIRGLGTKPVCKCA